MEPLSWHSQGSTVYSLCLCAACLFRGAHVCYIVHVARNLKVEPPRRCLSSLTFDLTPPFPEVADKMSLCFPNRSSRCTRFSMSRPFGSIPSILE
ncbi:hypothetical protein V8C37DRAFT_233226 [Trichoderma ceciliae]